MDEVEERQYKKGDFLFVVYKDGASGDRKAKGSYVTEDDQSVTIDIGGYILRIFKTSIYKIEQPKNNTNRRDFDY
jgi:hypothetical protein